MTLYHEDQVREAAADSFSEGIDHRHGDHRSPVMPERTATAAEIAADLRADLAKLREVLEALGLIVWDSEPDWSHYWIPGHGEPWDSRDCNDPEWQKHPRGWLRVVNPLEVLGAEND